MTGREIVFAPDGRLRAGWRILLFLLVVALAATTVNALLGPAIVWGLLAIGVRGAADTVIMLVALLLAHWFMLAAVDRRPWSTVWLDADAARPSAWVRGFLLGALAIGLPIALLIAAHWLARTNGAPGGPGGWIGAAFRVSVLLVPAALVEELVTRGYVLSALRDAFGWPVAIAAMSLAFGLLHLRNPDVSAESIALVTLAGVFLGAVVWATRSLYSAWMAHFAWNFTMAVIFHAAVSGLPLEAPGYRYVDAGPDWATGGPWGPEGGAAGAIGMLGGLTYLIARRRRREET